MKKKKIYGMLLAMLMLCGCETREVPVEAGGWYVPLGIEILAYVGFVAIVALLAIFILSFGEAREE